jgi:hypothetical protein
VSEPRLAEHDRTPRVLRPSEPTLVPPVPVPTPAAAPKVARSTKALVGAVTVGVVGALTFLLWDRSAGTPVVTAPPPEPRPPAAALAVPADPPRPPPAVAVPAPPPVVEKAEPPPPVEEGEPGTLAIPLIGSAKGMQFYKLAEPPGLVINLPHAYPKPGSRVPGGGAFKRMAVQRKGQGSQLRVYFQVEQAADVSADSSGLRVIVRGKRSGKKS